MNQILTLQNNNEPNKNFKNGREQKIINKNEKQNILYNQKSYYPNANVYDNENLKTQDISKDNQSEKADIKKVIKVFCAMIIVFGLIFIGKSTYAIISNAPKQTDNPQVSVERVGSKVNFTVATEKPIKELSYKWNDGESTTVEGDGTVSMTQTILIPIGNNILKITVIDYYGNKTYYQNQYIKESSDETEPTIDLSVSGTKLKITAKDETEISYLTYKWNDGTETRIDAKKGDKQIEQEIDVMKGQNKLIITAVDKQENRAIRTETIIGANKPTFTINTEDSYLVIYAKDDYGISKITVNVDGNVTDSGETSLNQKEINAKVKLESGDHQIKVTVTNVNGLSETKELAASM